MILPERFPLSITKRLLILRLWRDDQPDVPTWRASVEIPETGRRIGFASLEQLFAFLIDISEKNCDLNTIGKKSQGGSE
jgi:hypothetical protein